ncbi:hypothetical protein ENBRE01_3115 [Enteropsectra breve]|nr:hypothetical protein ENBRE01_3115 [Enteropsectra breve]
MDLANARIYRGSNLRNAIERISDPRCYVLGDFAFSGFKKIKTCTSTIAVPLSSEEEYELSRQRIIIENAFGRFKGKFKRFDTRVLNGNKERYITIIKSSMWLHNFIIINVVRQNELRQTD